MILLTHTCASICSSLYSSTTSLVEPTPKPKTLLVFGAGHVSMPTARLAAEIGFRVVVADDRASFANRQRFAAADQILVPPDFGSALDGLAGCDLYVSKWPPEP